MLLSHVRAYFISATQADNVFYQDCFLHVVFNSLLSRPFWNLLQQQSKLAVFKKIQHLYSSEKWAAVMHVLQKHPFFLLLDQLKSKRSFQDTAWFLAALLQLHRIEVKGQCPNNRKLRFRHLGDASKTGNATTAPGGNQNAFRETWASKLQESYESKHPISYLLEVWANSPAPGDI